LEQTAAQRQWQSEHERKQAEYMRWKNTWLKFWQACRHKACRRHKRCSGVEQACWLEQGANFPPILKEQLKLAIKFMREGVPAAEAFATARTTLLRELEEQIARAELEAREAVSATHCDGIASCVPLAGTIEPPTPRVRLA
jgi:hypothetical protein